MPPKRTVRGGTAAFGSRRSLCQRAMTCRTFRCWRLYSWMRFTWTSKRLSGSHATPARASTTAARSALLARFTARHFARNAASSASGSRRRSRSRSFGQPSPIASVTSAASRGFARARKRRGVTPFVTFTNFSGHSSWKSRSTSAFRSSVWSAATPLMRWLPTLARWAIRTERPPASSIRLRRASALPVPRVAAPHLVEEAVVDLVDDLEVAREDRPEHLDLPLLERLGQQRVVRVGERPPRDLPGLVPAHPVDVHEEAHQLGHRRSRGACR